MKKITIGLIAILCALLFAGCSDRTLTGEVSGVKEDAQGGFSFVLESGGDPISVTADADTLVFSWVEGLSEKELKTGSADGIYVSVTGSVSGASMRASEIQIEGQLVRGVHTLKDGTPIDAMKGFTYTMYCLEDGTELLMVQDPVGPGNIYTGGEESLAELPQEAQERITSYYGARGLLYDEFQLLQDAYDAFSAEKEDFQSHWVEQEVCPSASSDEVIYFLTSLTGSEYGMQNTCAAFDKQTGEVIPAESLFTCQPGEIISCLASAAGIYDPEELAQMEAAFRPELVCFFPDNLDITFPAGTLPSHEIAHGMVLDYGEEVRALLQPWAVPSGMEQ